MKTSQCGFEKGRAILFGDYANMFPFRSLRAEIGNGKSYMCQKKEGAFVGLIVGGRKGGGGGRWSIHALKRDLVRHWILHEP